jgi:thermostable 8-oxoguanine DNA glycosylase
MPLPTIKLELLSAMAWDHKSEAIELFEEKRRLCSRRNGLWHELVYCILAGTQVPMESARFAHAAAISYFGRSFSPKGFSPHTDSVSKLATLLKDAGYRYHTTKAQVVGNAATFFLESYRGSIRSFLDGHSADYLEAQLTANVNGIGIKIANHWLRNIGLDTCTIDIHLKRLFDEFAILSESHETEAGKFRAGISAIRSLASFMNMPVGETQYALWLAARARYGRAAKEVSQQQLSLFNRPANPPQKAS